MDQRDKQAVSLREFIDDLPLENLPPRRNSTHSMLSTEPSWREFLTVVRNSFLAKLSLGTALLAMLGLSLFILQPTSRTLQRLDKATTALESSSLRIERSLSKLEVYNVNAERGSQLIGIAFTESDPIMAMPYHASGATTQTLSLTPIVSTDSSEFWSMALSNTPSETHLSNRVQPVPEPSIITLMILGIASMTIRLRRSQRLNRGV